MEVDYGSLVDHRPDLQKSAEVASIILESEIGTPASEIRARWTADQDPLGRTIIGLEIADSTGSVGYGFWPDELSEIDHMKARLHRIWGDLMMVQMHSRMDNLNWRLRRGEAS